MTVSFRRPGKKAAGATRVTFRRVGVLRDAWDAADATELDQVPVIAPAAFAAASIRFCCQR